MLRDIDNKRFVKTLNLPPLLRSPETFLQFEAGSAETAVQALRQLLLIGYRPASVSAASPIGQKSAAKITCARFRAKPSFRCVVGNVLPVCGERRSVAGSSPGFGSPAAALRGAFSMDVATANAENAGEMVKDELAEKCQKLFQAFLEE